jgi:hypothetical protein
MAKDSLDSSVSMHFFVQNFVQRMQAYPWFDTNVGTFGLLLYQQESYTIDSSWCTFVS